MASIRKVKKRMKRDTPDICRAIWEGDGSYVEKMLETGIVGTKTEESMTDQIELGDMTLHEISILKESLESKLIQLCCQIEKEVAEKYNVGKVFISLESEDDGDDVLYCPRIKFEEEDTFLDKDVIRGNFSYSLNNGNEDE